MKFKLKKGILTDPPKYLIRNSLSLYPFHKNRLSTVVLSCMRFARKAAAVLYYSAKVYFIFYTAFLVSFAKKSSFRVGFNTIKFTKNKPTNQANATPIVSTFNSKLSFVKKST